MTLILESLRLGGVRGTRHCSGGWDSSHRVRNTESQSGERGSRKYWGRTTHPVETGCLGYDGSQSSYDRG